MIGRRRMLGTGALGLAGALTAATDADAGQRPDVDLERVVRAIGELRDALREQRAFGEIGAVRTAQQTFMRTNGKLPDYVEVGMDVWFAVHDWHVRWQLPPAIGRDPAGRYTIRLMETTVILRLDAQPGFVGIPYDNR